MSHRYDGMSSNLGPKTGSVGSLRSQFATAAWRFLNLGLVSGSMASLRRDNAASDADGPHMLELAHNSVKSLSGQYLAVGSILRPADQSSSTV